MKRILILFLIIIGLYILFQKVSQLEWFGVDNKNIQTAVTKDIDLIDLHLSSVRTTIIPEKRDDVKVVYTGKEKVTVQKNGDTIDVSVHHKWFTFFDWPSFSKKNQLKLYIPDDYQRDMSINLGSGQVNFAGQSNHPIHLDDFTVDIGSGRMDLKNISVNQFEHDLSSGVVTIDSLKTKSGSLGLSSGKMTIKHYSGPIDATVSSGKLDLQLDQLTDTVQVNVSSGYVGLNLPNKADFTLKGAKSSGNIACDFPLKNQKLDKHLIEGKYGSGRHKIDLTVSSGKVKVY